MRDLREILARDKDVLWAIFQPEPTYLGDPEPPDGHTITETRGPPAALRQGPFFTNGRSGR